MAIKGLAKAAYKFGKKPVLRAVLGEHEHVLHAVETAEHIQHLRHSAHHIRHDFKGFTENPNVQTAHLVGKDLVGVIGVSTFYGQLAKYAVKLATRSHQAGIDAANEMVDLMKSRVPQDSGALLNGISWEEDNGTFTVTASAISPTGSHEDYAPFVEYGTQFDEPQPFFWNSADETLEKWRDVVQRIPNEE
jgi:HK97 gp10 family phage protein